MFSWEVPGKPVLCVYALDAGIVLDAHRYKIRVHEEVDE